MTRAPARLLIIAGSDSSGGAGIQADIKTACAFGVYAMTAVTAVTAQDTDCVHAIHCIPAAMVARQIDCCLSDIGADAIKIGMLGSGEIALAVADILEEQARGIPLVLDPVLASTSGTSLLDEAAISILKERLFPITTLLTPNIPEAETLSRISIQNTCDMRRAGDALRAFGLKAALVKGGHCRGDQIDDVLAEVNGTRIFSGPRIDSGSLRGTGCTLATVIACGLAQTLPMEESIVRAREFVQHAIRTAPALGHGSRPLNHLRGNESQYPKPYCHPRESGESESRHRSFVENGGQVAGFPLARE